MPHHTPTVFVVDPDPSVRASLEALVRQAGWTPVTFTSAIEFLGCPRLPAQNYLVLEVALSDPDGIDVLRRLAVDRIESPVIVLSAQSDIPLTVRAMKAGAVDGLMELWKRHDSLSCRERQVMHQVVAGLLNKQVGAALGISEITVKAHRGRMMRKMGADSLAELVRIAMRLRLPPAAATFQARGSTAVRRPALTAAAVW